MISSTELKQLLGEENVLENEPMLRHTTFRCGGPADFFLMPGRVPDLMDAISLLKEREVPYFVLGRGSNLLVSDSGFRGAVITLKKHMSHLMVDECSLVAEGGAMLSECARLALEKGLTGLEFAAGIPGTVGGGLIMNAGAYGSELKDVVLGATVLNGDGTVSELSVEELELSYRHSGLMERDAVVLSVEFALTPGDPEAIKARMDELAARRREKQPLEFGSAGSTFKRPENHFAGALIEGAGLKGYRVGGAEVSEKHAGFVINRDNATAADVLAVIRHTEACVLEKYGVSLEREVRLLGEF